MHVDGHLSECVDFEDDPRIVAGSPGARRHGHHDQRRLERFVISFQPHGLRPVLQEAKKRGLVQHGYPEFLGLGELRPGRSACYHH